MWTWGIDMATQQARPAVHSRVCRIHGGNAMRCREAAGRGAPAARTGPGLFSSMASGGMTIRQKMPTARWVVRQPWVRMAASIRVGQTAPEM